VAKQGNRVNYLLHRCVGALFSGALSTTRHIVSSSHRQSLRAIVSLKAYFKSAVDV